MKVEKGVAIVVTYNRKEKLSKCIDCLLDQTVALDRIFVVNNASTDGTEELLENVCRRTDKIVFHTLEENTGGSGGFYHGIKWAYDEGANWIWGMDDDAFPNNDALEKILIEREQETSLSAYWSNPNKDIFFDSNKKKVHEWMFVGFFLPRDIINDVGFPRNDFFIYYDDIEYADRIINHGYNIYKVRDSIIDHQDDVSILKVWKIGSMSINVRMLPKQNWKVYYLARNDLLRFQKGDKRRFNVYKRNFRRVIKTFIYNPTQIWVLLKGIWHGIIGKSGKVMIP